MYLLLGKAGVGVGVGVGAEQKKKMAGEQYCARCYSQILLIEELEKIKRTKYYRIFKIFNWVNKLPTFITIGILIVSCVLMALFLEYILKIS